MLLTAAATTADAQRVPLRSRAGARPAPSSGPTFSKDIAGIFQENCQSCHHPGEVAPFSLMDYENARPISEGVKRVVESGYMPPWKPVVGAFNDERRLERREIDLIVEWVDNGSPEGDPRDLPEPLVFGEDWTLGEPDLVLQLPVDYEPNRAVEDDYRCFSLPTGLTGNQQIEAVEVRPDNRKVVHHVLLFPDPAGESAVLEAANEDGQPGYTCFGDPGFDTLTFLAGWAPGNRPQVLPEGVGQTLAAGGRVALQIHYHPDGTRQLDRTRIGLHFRETPAAKELTYLPLINQNFSIPPGAARHEVTAEFTVPTFPRINARIYSLLPHMHLLGREIQLELTIDGRTETVIRIDDWDFRWQDTYWLKEPLLAPAGSVLKLTAVYDNSSDNPLNPNSPPVAVGWGEGTNDEMALVFIGFTVE